MSAFRRLPSLTAALLATACANIPPMAPMSVIPDLDITTSHALNTEYRAAKGAVLYRETSPGTEDGALTNADLEEGGGLVLKVQVPQGTKLVSAIQSGNQYYCTESSAFEDPLVGRMPKAACFRDADNDRRFETYYAAPEDYRTAIVVQLGPETKLRVPLPYTPQKVALSSAPTAVELVFAGVQDGYVRIDQTIGYDGEDPLYRRSFYSALSASGGPPAEPMTFPLRVFGGVTVPARTARTQEAVLQVRQASDQSLSYVMVKGWGKWAIKELPERSSSHTTLPAIRAPYDPAPDDPAPDGK